MKKLIFLLIICLSNTIINAQSNYTKVTVPLAPVKTTTATDALSLLSSKLVNFSYTDGIGRQVQSIGMRQANGDDVVSFTKYDQFGRSLKTYSPYIRNVNGTTAGQFVSDPFTEQATFYSTNTEIANTAYPFAETELEKSPAQRPLKQGGIGANWQLTGANVSQAEYLLNTANEVIKFSLTTTSNILYSASAMNGTLINYYPANTLVKNANIDVSGVRTETFTDMQGRKICSRVYARVSTDANGYYYTEDLTNGTNLNQLSGTPVALSSYYIYDDLGQMIYEVPHNAIKAMGTTLTFGDILTTNQNVFTELIYAYHYDERDRLIEKHVPGTLGSTTTNSGWYYFVYNKLDQLVLSQDPVQRLTNWTFSKYDEQNRVILTGKFNNTDTRATAQTNVNANLNLWENRFTGAGNVQGYTNLAYPTTQAEIYTISYYDDYDFGVGTYTYQPWQTNKKSNRTRGMLTGSKVKILGTTNTYLLSVNYYDEFGRTIQSHIQHHKTGKDVYNNEYDFTGKLIKSQRDHTYGTNPLLTIVNTYTYDTQGRPISVLQKTGADPEITISTLSYNLLGQVTKKGIHSEEGTDYMQNIDYRYNEKGWLTSINNSPIVDDGGTTNSDINDVFGEEILYNTGNIANTTTIQSNTGINMFKRYDGNIAAIKWMTKDPTTDGSTLNQNCYVYRYDDLGRMTGGFYATDRQLATTSEIFDFRFHSYDEKVNYDINGNLISLKRRRVAATIDDLTYTYTNNGYKLKKVEDVSTTAFNSAYPHFINGSNTATEYTYDKNGNQLTDVNKGFTYTYNYLNLPVTIQKVIGASTHAITFTYDATGKLLSKKLTSTPVAQMPAGIDREYIDGIEYGGGSTMMYAATAEGVVRVKPVSATNTTAYVYDYYIKDHLGNVRAVITNENATYTTITPPASRVAATMELAADAVEDPLFDNIDETRKNKTADYPYNPDYPINEKVSKLSTTLGETVGPATIVAVKQGDEMSVSTDYYFTTPTLPQTNQTASQILTGIINGIATAGLGTLPTDDMGAVINPFSDASSEAATGLNNFISSSFDSLNLSLPQGYLVTMFFDNDLNLVPEYSGVQRVTEAGSLQKLAVMNQKMPTDGFYYTYVTNQSAQVTQFDNLTYVHIEGQLKEANDYYPYGLLCSSATIGTYGNYKFQDKEWNKKEFANTWGLDWYNHGARMYDPELGRWHVQDPAGQFGNPYLAMGNNPANMIDPDGQFITWGISNGGFSIGVNFTPVGVPLGFGINVGWSDGFSPGVYGEVGPRVGGTGFGSGITVSQGLNYNFKHKTWNTNTTAGAYASFGMFNLGGSVSANNDITNDSRSNSWSVSAGVGFGDDKSGSGLNVSYGSSGWSLGAGGYYNSKAWDSNPAYEPDKWNDDGDIQNSNNCYSYALDDPDNPLGGKPQPGQYSGDTYDNLTLKDITNAAIRDGHIKRPNVLNKLGFGKKRI